MYRVLFEGGSTSWLYEDEVVFAAGTDNLEEIAYRNPGKDIINKDNILMMRCEEDVAE